MIKFLLLDCDGIIVDREKYFSQRLVEQGIEIDMNKVKEFFIGDFLLCETGKKDLKEELVKQLPQWKLNWSVDDVLHFWFSGERALNQQMVNKILEIKQKGVKVYIATDQEKYRTQDLWNEVGLRNFTDGIFSSADLGFLKSDIQYWQEVFKKLPKHQKHEVLFCDHEDHKIKPAKEFGYLTEKYIGFEQFSQKIKTYL